VHLLNHCYTTSSSQHGQPRAILNFIAYQISGVIRGLLGTRPSASGVLQMRARYCLPENRNASRANTIQHLQHAITNTKDYWNGVDHPNGFGGTEYSWIDYARREHHAIG